MSDTKILQDIEQRVRETMCLTHSERHGSRVEGRITADDFEALINLLERMQKAERERCAYLYEQVNPASDLERANGDPGAGAMGAVLEFRDLIRAQ